MSEHDVVTGAEPALPERTVPAAPGVLAPALAALLCVVSTVVTWRLFVGTRRGQLIEEAARIGSADAREAFAGVTGVLLGAVSVPLLVIVVGGAVLVSLARGRWSIAVAAIVLLAGTNITTQALQELLARPELDASPIALNSFPSGHVTVAASIAATALLVAPVGWRPALALLGALLTATMGISTMIGNEVAAWHRGSDVMAALLLTAAWYFAIEAVLAALAVRDGAVRPAATPAPRLHKAALRILAVLGGIGAGLAIGALAATAVRVPITSDPGYQVAFLGSIAGVASVTCFVIALMLRLRPHHPAPRPATL